MPELPVKEVRLPELHLPEISREEILRTLSEVRRPDIDLLRIERPRLDIAEIDLPRMARPSIDLAALVAGSVAALGFGRPRVLRSRWAFAAALVALAGLAAVVAARNDGVRAQVDRAARGVGARVEGWRSRRADLLEVEADRPAPLVETGETADPIEPADAPTDASAAEASDRVANPGSAAEETATRA